MDFEAWWQQHGQFCRAGGGQYEKTFAFHAWEAAHDECARLCDELDDDPDHLHPNDCAHAIRLRSNAALTGSPEAQP